jgi:hypothetical protein
MPAGSVSRTQQQFHAGNTPKQTSTGGAHRRRATMFAQFGLLDVQGAKQFKERSSTHEKYSACFHYFDNAARNDLKVTFSPAFPF